MSKKQFKIYGIYDTETCNIGEGNETRAYPILFIYNDIGGIDLTDYKFGEQYDNISFYRNSTDFLKKIANVIEEGNFNDEIPVDF